MQALCLRSGVRGAQAGALLLDVPAFMPCVAGDQVAFACVFLQEQPLADLKSCDRAELEMQNVANARRATTAADGAPAVAAETSCTSSRWTERRAAMQPQRKWSGPQRAMAMAAGVRVATLARYSPVRCSSISAGGGCGGGLGTGIVARRSARVALQLLGAIPITWTAFDIRRDAASIVARQHCGFHPQRTGPYLLRRSCHLPGCTGRNR